MKKFKFISILAISILIFQSCDSPTKNPESKSGKEITSSDISGVYQFKNRYRKMSITVTSNSWSGIFQDGMGDGTYTYGTTAINGKVKGNELFDEYGYEKRGYVSGKSLYYSDPLGQITLTK